MGVGRRSAESRSAAKKCIFLAVWKMWHHCFLGDAMLDRSEQQLRDAESVAGEDDVGPAVHEEEPIRYRWDQKAASTLRIAARLEDSYACNRKRKETVKINIAASLYVSRRPGKVRARRDESLLLIFPLIRPLLGFLADMKADLICSPGLSRLSLINHIHRPPRRCRYRSSCDPFC
jgi:hypothetical protein